MYTTLFAGACQGEGRGVGWVGRGGRGEGTRGEGGGEGQKTSGGDKSIISCSLRVPEPRLQSARVERQYFRLVSSRAGARAMATHACSTDSTQPPARAQPSKALHGRRLPSGPRGRDTAPPTASPAAACVSARATRTPLEIRLGTAAAATGTPQADGYRLTHQNCPRQPAQGR